MSKKYTGRRWPAELSKGACLSLAILASSTALAQRVGPPMGEIYQAWVTERLSKAPSYDVLSSDDLMISGFVNDVISPYAPLRSTPFRFAGRVWTSVLQKMLSRGYPMTLTEATEALAYDVGMTRGYAGLSDPLVPLPSLEKPWAAEQIVKAGVSVDIARKALELAGEGAYAVAANYAVAMQVLVEKMACFTPERWDEIGLRSDVAARFMNAARLAEIDDFDLVYLSRLLQGELSSWRPGGLNIYGRRQLPTVLRIARVAAAYRDLQGYSHEPCTESGVAKAGVAATSPLENARTMCFVDATDRAVYAWYLKTIDAQMDPTRSNFITRQGDGMTLFLHRVRPMWQGAFSNDVLRAGVSVELAESLVADEVAITDDMASRAEDYARRRLEVLCSKEAAL